MRLFNAEPQKIKKISRIVRIVLDIWKKILIVVGVIVVLMLIFLLLAPADLIKLPQSGNEVIWLTFDGMINYRVGRGLEFAKIRPIFAALIPVIIFGTYILTEIFSQIVEILKTVEMGTPFDEKNSKRLSRIALVLIVGSGVWNYVQSFAVKTIIETFNIPNLYVNFSFDRTMLFTGLLILILAGVFKYGNYLQNEYDSTL